MGEWIRWIVGLTITVLILAIPAVGRLYSLVQLLHERVAGNKTAIEAECKARTDADEAERQARIAADTDQCRRINNIEDTMETHGQMLERIDERTGWIMSGLQRVGVIDSHQRTGSGDNR